MPQLKALARELKLVGHSRLRKAQLIAFIKKELRRKKPVKKSVSRKTIPSGSINGTANGTNDSSLTKRQLKRIRNKKSKTAKKYKNLSREVEALKLQISEQKNRLDKLKNNKNSKYKKKKVRIISRELSKLTSKLNEVKVVINEMDSRRNNDERGSINERIKNLNKRIRRAKNKRNKDRLIQERERLESGESNEWDPRELDGAFGGAYRRYRIDGVERMDIEMFFNRTGNYIKNFIIKETKGRAARTQAITWIRFTRDDVEIVDFAFYSRMMTVYDLNDKGEIVNAMLEHVHGSTN